MEVLNAKLLHMQSRFSFAQSCIQYNYFQLLIPKVNEDSMGQFEKKLCSYQLSVGRVI